MKTRTLARFVPLDLPLALFLLAAGLAVIPALDRSLSWPPLFVLLGCGGLYALVSRAGAKLSWETAILRIAIILIAAVALFFVTQYGHYNEAVGKIGVTTWLAQMLARLSPKITLWQPLGNSIGTLLEGMVFLCTALVLTERQRLWRGLAATATLLVGLALLLSESRGAWLAVAAGTAVWLGLRNRLARWLILAGLVGGVLLTVWVVLSGGLSALERVPVLGGLLSALFFRPDRLEVYRGSLYLIQDQPFTGLGLGGQFPWIYSRYVLLIQVPFLYYSHNFYLETWLQIGLLGMMALVWIISTVILLAWRARAEHLTAPIAAGLTAVLAHGLTDARQYNDPWTWLPFFLLLGLLGAVWRQRETERARPGWWFWLPLSVPLFLIATLGGMRNPLAAWQANLGSVAQARVEIPAMMQNHAAAQTDLMRAETLLRASVQRLPEQRSAHLRLGLMLTSREDFDEAVVHLEVALRADPGNPVTRKALGLAYTWAGQVEQAAEMLADTPGVVEELNQYVHWRETQGQHDLAINAARVSLALDSEQPALREALERLGE